MKTQKFALLIAIFSLFTLASCDKNKDPKAKSKEDMLTEKKWKTTAFTINPGILDPESGTVITDFYAQYDDCDKDDYVQFMKNGQFISDQGATRCDASDPQTETGTWVFIGDKTKITITSSGSSYTADVLELTDNNVKLQYTVKNPNTGVNYTFSETLTKM
ncbi:MAG: lipocalin family protein [Cytophagales bacterium]|nr:lipocalin family protein [Cytophagales bacterium]